MASDSRFQEFQVYKYHKQFVQILGKQIVPPTQTARLIFIFSSAAYHSLSFFYKIKLYDNFPEHSIPFLKSISDYEILLKLTIAEMLTQYSPTLEAEKVYVPDNNINLKRAWNILKSYLAVRFLDGWNAKSNFVLPNGDNVIKLNVVQNFIELGISDKWTPIQNTTPLGAHWPNVRGSIPSEIKDTLVSKYYNEIYPETTKVSLTERSKQVLDVSQNLVDEQKMCAELWEGATLTPPAINYALLISLMASKNISLHKACKILLMVGTALFEASILVWTIKYGLLEPRPIQTIRKYHANVDTNYHYGKSKGSLWCPYQKISSMTPNFADAPSGHSCFSSVFAYIVSTVFGKVIPGRIEIIPEFLPLISKILAPNFEKKIPTYLNEITITKNSSAICNLCPSKNIVFKYRTWKDIAEHAGISRVYGGIHYFSSNYDSLFIGKLLAKEILKYYAE